MADSFLAIAEINESMERPLRAAVAALGRRLLLWFMVGTSTDRHADNIALVLLLMANTLHDAKSLGYHGVCSINSHLVTNVSASAVSRGTYRMYLPLPLHDVRATYGPVYHTCHSLIILRNCNCVLTYIGINSANCNTRKNRHKRGEVEGRGHCIPDCTVWGVSHLHDHKEAGICLSSMLVPSL